MYKSPVVQSLGSNSIVGGTVKPDGIVSDQNIIYTVNIAAGYSLALVAVVWAALDVIPPLAVKAEK